MRGLILVTVLLIVLAQVLAQNQRARSKPNTKPGICPKSASLHGRCGDSTVNGEPSCRTDSDCQGNKKCCREGCGKICKGVGILRDTGTYAQCYTQTGMRTEGGLDCNRWCMNGGSNNSKFYGGYCYPDGYWMTREGKGYCWCY